jgi:hypothetical protein
MPRKTKRKTRNTIKKKENTSKLRTKDYFGILGASLICGLIIWGIFYFVSDQASWTTFIISCVISIPIGYWWQKKSSQCPSCKKDFQMSDTHTETIREYQKFETRKRTDNGIQYKDTVPVDIREYWQYTECDSCGFETRRAEKSKRDA